MENRTCLPSDLGRPVGIFKGSDYRGVGPLRKCPHVGPWEFLVTIEGITYPLNRQNLQYTHKGKEITHESEEVILGATQ